MQTSKSNGGKIFQYQLLLVIFSVHLTSAGFCDIQSLVSQYGPEKCCLIYITNGFSFTPCMKVGSDKWHILLHQTWFVVLYQASFASCAACLWGCKCVGFKYLCFYCLFHVIYVKGHFLRSHLQKTLPSKSLPILVCCMLHVIFLWCLTFNFVPLFWLHTVWC